MYSKIFMLLAAIMIFASCEKENIDRTKTKTKTGDPSEIYQEFNLEISDQDDKAIESATIEIYHLGQIVETLETSASGSVIVKADLITDPNAPLIILASKSGFEDAVLRVETNHFKNGSAELNLLEAGSGAFGSNGLASMMQSATVLISGQVSNYIIGEPIFFAAMEPAALNGDTTVFQYAGVQFDSQGNFSFLAPANTDLYFTLFGFDLCTPSALIRSFVPQDIMVGTNLYVEDIGQFAVDSNIGMYTITRSSALNFAISGQGLNCDTSNIVAGGQAIVTLNWNSTSITMNAELDANGDFATVLPGCSASSIPGSVSVQILSPLKSTLSTAVSQVVTSAQTSVSIGTIYHCN